MIKMTPLVVGNESLKKSLLDYPISYSICAARQKVIAKHGQSNAVHESYNLNSSRSPSHYVTKSSDTILLLRHSTNAAG